MQNQSCFYATATIAEQEVARKIIAAYTVLAEEYA
jgi:hypothetical protein